MKWEDFKNKRREREYTNAEITDIECPVCGKHIYVRTDIVLTSYPPQYRYFCECGWSGTA